ncbi:PEP/pyruvate-binding domain-containing protein [Micrococcoides hystricis]|uniref:PEP/pyruvate-binding domain-containing protein n=1 Tax=Micrococcoides hystricis TaxID=1572761 RepID=A0ABV6PEG1_9MICC
MLKKLSETTRTDSGGKAASLGLLLRAGLPVPDGFVVPGGTLSPDTTAGRSLQQAVARALEELGNPVVAVRSSAMDEDSTEASAAGQYHSVIGVHGTAQVWQAITEVRASARTSRVHHYWSHLGRAHPLSQNPSVLVQPIVEADVSGVMFTPQHEGQSTRIEASWGLGLTVVGGVVAPDTYELAPDRRVNSSIGNKQTRVDFSQEHGKVVTTNVTPDLRRIRSLNDATVIALAQLGSRIADLLGGPQDIEWALTNNSVQILQSRPITASLPPPKAPHPSQPTGTLNGVPGSHGTITAPARVVHGPSDFSNVQAGDIMVCPYTDPAWTPLFSIAAGIITETGGALSHAAIVAREYGIPAVLGITAATTCIENGALVALNGTTGTVTIL